MRNNGEWEETYKAEARFGGYTVEIENCPTYEGEPDPYKFSVKGPDGHFVAGNHTAPSIEVAKERAKALCVSWMAADLARFTKATK